MAEIETQVITLTENAMKMARKFLSEEDNPDEMTLRVGVSSGGCSGFQYAVSVDHPKDDDIIQSYEGFRAEQEAAAAFEADPESAGQVDLTQELATKYKTEVAAKHGLTVNQAVEISTEGFLQNWPANLP